MREQSVSKNLASTNEIGGLVIDAPLKAREFGCVARERESRAPPPLFKNDPRNASGATSKRPFSCFTRVVDTMASPHIACLGLDMFIETIRGIFVRVRRKKG